MEKQWAESVEDWIGEDQAVRTGMLDSWVLDALGDISGRRIIDIGCGDGRFCRVLTALDAEVTGIDLTDAFVTRARASGTGRETYLVGDAEDLADLEDETFDLAVSYIVMVDLFDYEKSIQAAFRVLKLGGAFVVCNIHPMRMCQPAGWVTQGGQEAVLCDRRLHA